MGAAESRSFKVPSYGSVADPEQEECMNDQHTSTFPRPRGKTMPTLSPSLVNKPIEMYVGLAGNKSREATGEGDQVT